MVELIERILALHNALQRADLPHAFGGALALAWCTQRARGTIDVDLNVMLSQTESARLLSALPAEIPVSEAQSSELAREGQVRLWWGQTPVDLFLNNTEFHEELASRIRWESFAGSALPFLSCFDLAVFKAFFNRTKDWADLEAMQASDSPVLLSYGVAEQRRLLV